MSKTLNKYTVAFDYLDKILLILSATSGSIPTAYFATDIGALVAITNQSLSLVLFNIYEKHLDAKKLYSYLFKRFG